MAPHHSHTAASGLSPCGHSPIDWNDYWLAARRNASWSRKRIFDRDFWDRHWENSETDDTRRAGWILDHLEPLPDERILDVGAGTGLLTLPLAERARSVMAVDPSPVAIEKLEREAERRSLTNIRTIAAFWREVKPETLTPPPDTVLAAFTMGVVNPRPHIEKMIHSARQRVVIVEPAGLRHWQFPELWSRIHSEPFRPGPDYMGILNLLHQMKIFADVKTGTYLSIRRFPDFASAREKVLAALADTSPRAEKAVSAFLSRNLVQEKKGWLLRRRQSIAIISFTV